MDDINNKILNDIEQDKIMALVEDKVTFNALKKYILAVVYQHGTMKKGQPYNGTVNFAMQFSGQAVNAGSLPHSDEELGQNLRALTYATSLVESGFKELAELKKVEKIEETNINEAE